jgi:hypothetical protein
MAFIHAHRNHVTHPELWSPPQDWTSTIHSIQADFANHSSHGETWDYLILDDVWFNSYPYLVTIWWDNGATRHIVSTLKQGDFNQDLLKPIRSTLQDHATTRIMLTYLNQDRGGDYEPLQLWELEVMAEWAESPIFNNLLITHQGA